MTTLIAPKTSSSHPPAPEGTHIARCVSMIDLGTHETNGQFGVKRQHKLRLSFELPDEKAVFSEEKGEQPYMVHKEFTFSMHEKAALRLFLENWRGRKFTNEEARDFDIAKLVTVAALLNVIHNENGGRVYANIGSASRLAKGMTCPDQINPTTVFSIADYDDDVYTALPEWLQQKIAESDEWKTRVKGAKANAAADEEDDIPF